MSTPHPTGTTRDADRSPSAAADLRKRPSRRTELGLVTMRELRTQLFKKSAVISTLVILVLAVAGVLVADHFANQDKEPYVVGVAGSGTVPGLAPGAAGGIVGPDGESVDVVTMTRSQAEATLSGTADTPAVDMFVDVSGPTPELLVAKGTDSTVVNQVSSLLQQQALGEQVTALGGDPAEVSSALAAAVPQVKALGDDATQDEGYGQRYVVLMFVTVLMFIVIMGGGSAIAMGVVEEKSSRIVEILLATIRPSSLLGGKILGAGTAMILSYGLIGVVVGVTAKVVGLFPDVSIDLTGVVAAMLVWMVIGFAIYAVLFGAAGALVSRQEDVSSVTMPLVMLLMVPYMLSFALVTNDPESTLVRALSWVPPFAPFLMPSRLAMGTVNWAEQAGAMALAVVCIPLLTYVAGRIYRGGVLRTGARVPLREALRGRV